MVCPVQIARLVQARWVNELDVADAVEVLRDVLVEKVLDVLRAGGVAFSHPGADEDWDLPEVLPSLERATVARLVELVATGWRPVELGRSLRRGGGRRPSPASSEIVKVKKAGDNPKMGDREMERDVELKAAIVNAADVLEMEFDVEFVDASIEEAASELVDAVREALRRAEEARQLLREIEEPIRRAGGDPLRAVEAALDLGPLAKVVFLGGREALESAVRGANIPEEAKEAALRVLRGEREEQEREESREEREPEKREQEAERVCPCCGGAVAPGDRVCRRCGAPLDDSSEERGHDEEEEHEEDEQENEPVEPPRCPHCGRSLGVMPAYLAFCPRCFSELPEDVIEQAKRYDEFLSRRE